MRKVTGMRLGATCAVALVLGVTGCGSGDDDGGATEQPVRMELGEPQKALVPTVTTESEGSEVLNALFTPLIEYDKDKKPVESAIAQSVSTTDNKLWTIKLKPGFTFHNGEKLTAQSFADAWN